MGREVQVFADNLRRLRLERGLSQEALGFESGLHRTEISLLERAARDPRLTTMASLADGLDVPPAALLEGLSARGA